MTNLEWLEKRGLITKNCVYKDRYTDCGEVGVNIVITLRDCDYSDYKEKGIDWLLEEHKEHIKLKKWEKDLLNSLGTSCMRFNDYDFLICMKGMGYFNGIKDTSMRMKEILDNFEVEYDEEMD